MDTFKEFLIEDTTASTKFEGVIVDCFNLKNLPKEKFKKQIINEKLTKAFLKVHTKQWATYNSDVGEVLYDFSQLCKKKMGSGGIASAAGQGSPSLANFWKTQTGKKSDTSKADILISKLGVSVKGPSALLMSAEQKEAMATVKAAMGSETAVTNSLQEALESEVEDFLTTVRTVAKDDSESEMKKVTSTGIKGREKDTLSQVKPSKEDPKTGKIELGLSNADVRDKLDDAEQRVKVNAERAFDAAFSNNAIAKSFAREAMTGREKFSGKVFENGSTQTGEAEYMLVWDYSLTKLRYTPCEAMIGEVAKKLSMQATLKSSSYSKTRDGKKTKLGYSIYQSFRLAVKTALDDRDTIEGEANEQVKRAQNLLNEGMIDEFAFLDAIKGAWNWLKDKVTKIWNWLAEKILEIKEKIKELWNDGVDAVMNAFEVDVSVRVNKTIRL